MIGRSKDIYRLIFVAAGVYNVLFGLWAVLFPEAFFHLMEIPPPRYPAIWKCIGMIVGLYGVLYVWAGLHLDRADWIIGIGLLGKLLGPFGLLLTVLSGEWPARTYSLVVIDDLIWWIPFFLFLLRNWRFKKEIHATAPWICVTLNVIAGLYFFLYLLPGTEIVSELPARTTFIERNIGSWRTGWILWGAARLSLLGFLAWWAGQLAESRWTAAGLLTGGLGLCLDLIGGSIFIGWFPDHIETLERTGMLLTAGLGTGLYCVAGILLTLSTIFSRFWLQGWTWGVWMTGLGFSITVLLRSPVGMAITGSLMMIVLWPWIGVMGALFDPREQPQP